jgi:hypothetical protein
MDEHESDQMWARSRMVEERGLDCGVLCASCENGQVMRRKGNLTLMAYCSFGMGNALPVPTDLAECSNYSRRGELALHQMEKLALPVDGRVGINDGAYK